MEGWNEGREDRGINRRKERKTEEWMEGRKRG